MDKKKLTEQEMQLWLNYKETFKIVFSHIIKDNQDLAGISDGDYMVLDSLTNAKAGQLRPKELASKMGWSKSRLSHHLSRMEKRGLVKKQSLEKGNAIQVAITPKGKEAFAEVLPISAAGVKRYFLDMVTEQDAKWITQFAERVREKL